MITTVDVDASAGTKITGVNNKGEVCGSSGSNGFIREPDGSITTVIQRPGGGYDVTLYGINDSGEVLGVGKNYFLRNAGGTITDLHLSGSIGPLGINNAGQIVGFTNQQGTGIAEGYLQNADGSSITFEVPGSTGTVAQGINNSGQIVGFYGFIPTQYPNQVRDRGFVRNTDGTITTFDAPQFGSTMPNGIAGNGTIAASFSRNSGNTGATWASSASASCARRNQRWAIPASRRTRRSWRRDERLSAGKDLRKSLRPSGVLRVNFAPRLPWGSQLRQYRTSPLTIGMRRGGVLDCAGARQGNRSAAAAGGGLRGTPLPYPLRRVAQCPAARCGDAS